MIPASRNFKLLKQSVSIADVLNDKCRLHLFRTKGHRMVGPCPIHGGDNPGAFVVSLTKNTWYCFTRCNTGGDLISFVEKLLGFSPSKTADYLASLSGSAPQPRPLPEPHRVFTPFTRQLPLSPFSPFLNQKGISPQTAACFETGVYLGPGFLHQCIGVRLHDPAGSPIGYAGRYLNPGQNGKWKFPPKLPKNQILYNYHRIAHKQPQTLAIVECPWAVMRLAQLNIPAVALLGLHLSKTQFDLLRKIPHLILMLDADIAGRRAAIQLQSVFAPHVRIQILQLPQGCDPDDLDDASLSALVHPFFF